MEASLAAQGLLIEYMDARWMKDTLGAIVETYRAGLDVEARYLIFADLQYLDANRYGSIVGGIGSNVAKRRLRAQYASEVRKMQTSREKLMRHDLVDVSTVGQMKTLIQLKREHDWDFAINIGWEVENDGCGVERYREEQERILELANSALIPIRELRQVVQTTFSPDPLQTSDETRDESLRLDAPKKITEADAPKENITEGAAMDEDGDDNVDWEEDIEADASKENITEVAAMEEDDDDDID